MRLFLAIDLPKKDKKELDIELEVIKNNYPHFDWIPKENFHITLLFFGEVKYIDKIKSKIEEAIYEIDNFNLYTYRANLFLNSKIVLHVNFRRAKLLEKLVEKVKNQFSIRDRQKFIPHLTIARYRVPSKQQYLNLKKKLNQLNIDINFPVRKIYLFQSILTGKKPVYKKIAIFPLQHS